MRRKTCRSLAPSILAASSTSIGTWTLGAYAGGQWDDFSLKSGLAHSWHRLATRREVNINPDSDFEFTDSLTAAERFLQQHELILRAIRERDARRAGQVMAMHMCDIETGLLAQIDE
jgi:hypothetical protein